MKSITHKGILFLFALLIIPVISYAQGVPCIDPGAPCITDFNFTVDILLRLVWIVFTVIAVVCFVAAGVLFLTAQGDPSKLKIARSAVIWGVAGIVVGIIAFSIITIIGSALT